LVAAEMDRTSCRYQIGRRPMIAVVAKSRLRVTETCQLRRLDVDVHHERLVVSGTNQLRATRGLLALPPVSPHDAQHPIHEETLANARAFAMEPTGIEPVTSCLQNDRADPL
jgi:hypothetical protein